MRTLKELFEQTERGLSPVLDSIRDRNSSAEVDEDDFTEEAAGAVGVAGATKKVASKAKASASSKSKELAKTKAAKKEEPAAKAKEAKKPASAKPEPKKAPVAAPKKSTYAKGLDPVGYQEWEDAPVKKVKQLSSPEPVAKASVPPTEPIPPAIEPAAPVVEPKTPSVNTAPTQAVVDDAVTAAQKTPPPSSISQQVAEVVESKPSLPPSKTFGEPIYGDAPPSAGKALSAADDVALKTPLLQRVMSAASSPIGRKVLGGMGVLGMVSSLYGGEGEGPEPNDPYLNPPKKTDYTPDSTEKSDLNPLMASSKYDTVGNIVADAIRPPEAPTPSSVQAAIGPSPRTISAGEPSAAVVKKQLREADLAPAIGLDAAQQVAQEEDFLQKFKAARAEEEEKLRIVNLQEALDTFLSGRAGIKPQSERYEKLRQQVYKDVEKKEGAEEEAEKKNPKSKTSMAMRGLLKEQGITVPENISAYFIEKQYPQFANIINRRLAAEERAEARRERAEERAERNLDKLDSEKKLLAIRLAPKVQNEQYKTLVELQAQKAIIDEAVTNPNPQRDTSMFYSFVKALDPNSVVREGEIKFSQAARSIPSSIRGLFNKGFKGQMLLPEERKNIQDFMDQRLKLAHSAWEASSAPYLKQADSSKIDRELVAPGTTFFEPEQKKTIPLKEKLAGKAGKTFTDKTGKRYVVNADEVSATEL